MLRVLTKAHCCHLAGFTTWVQSLPSMNIINLHMNSMLADMNVKIYTHLKTDIYGTAVTKLYSCRELLFQEFWIDYFRLDYEGLPPEVEVLVDLMRVEVDGEMAGSC